MSEDLPALEGPTTEMRKRGTTRGASMAPRNKEVFAHLDHGPARPADPGHCLHNEERSAQFIVHCLMTYDCILCVCCLMSVHVTLLALNAVQLAHAGHAISSLALQTAVNAALCQGGAKPVRAVESSAAVQAEMRPALSDMTHLSYESRR